MLSTCRPNTEAASAPPSAVPLAFLVSTTQDTWSPAGTEASQERELRLAEMGTGVMILVVLVSSTSLCIKLMVLLPTAAAVT